MRSPIKLGRVLDIEISLHPSWLIIFLVVTLTLIIHFGDLRAEWTTGLKVVAALAATIIFFSSIITHELGHALAARYYKIRVSSITLFLFGGVAQIDENARRPGAELIIAIAGPLTSVALGGLFALAGSIADPLGLCSAIFPWLSVINFALAAFNLLPAFPLDGGHLLRSLVWLITGNERRAHLVAIECGQALAMMIIILGAFIFFKTTSAFSGLWLALLGWYIYGAARDSEKEALIDEVLKDLTAADLMVADTVPSACEKIEASLVVAPDTSARRCAEIFDREMEDCLYVLEEDKLLGVIHLEHFINMIQKLLDNERAGPLPPQSNATIGRQAHGNSG